MFSIVIPAYNESPVISSTLRAVCNVLSNSAEPWEVLVVDDGSTDSTYMQVKQFMAANPKSNVRILQLHTTNKGKGAAVRDGLLEANGDVVAYFDADLDIPAEELLLLRHWVVQGYDVVVGSKRHLRFFGSPVPFRRRVVSVAFSTLVKWMFRIPVSDTQTGIKVLRGAPARAIAQHISESGFLFDVEVLAYATAWGLSIKEAPVRVTAGLREGRIGAKDIARSIFQFAQLTFRLRKTLRTSSTALQQEVPDATANARLARQ